MSMILENLFPFTFVDLFPLFTVYTFSSPFRINFAWMVGVAAAGVAVVIYLSEYKKQGFFPLQ